MKNRSILLVLMIMFVLQNLSSVAQETFRPYFELGVKTGISLSKVYFSPKVDQFLHQGTYMGVVATYYSELGLAISAECNLVEKGWEEDLDEGKYIRTLRYIEVPVLSRFTFGGKYVKMLIELGPYAAFYRGSDLEWEATPGTEPLAYYQSEIASKTEYGLGVGLGAVLVLKHLRVQGSVRVMQAINGIFETTNGSFNFAQNQYLSAGLSLYFSSQRNTPQKVKP